MENIFNTKMGIIINLALLLLIIIILGIAFKGYRDSIKYKELEEKVDVKSNKSDDEN